jgi:hypothetical protein
MVDVPRAHSSGLADLGDAGAMEAIATETPGGRIQHLLAACLSLVLTWRSAAARIHETHLGMK